MTLEELLGKERAEGIAEGKLEGQAESVMLLLTSLGTVPQQICECISQEKNPDVLTKWLRAAAQADSVEAFIKSM